MKRPTLLSSLFWSSNEGETIDDIIAMRYRHDPPAATSLSLDYVSLTFVDPVHNEMYVADGWRRMILLIIAMASIAFCWSVLSALTFQPGNLYTLVIPGSVWVSALCFAFWRWKGAMKSRRLIRENPQLHTVLSNALGWCTVAVRLVGVYLAMYSHNGRDLKTHHTSSFNYVIHAMVLEALKVPSYMQLFLIAAETVMARYWDQLLRADLLPQSPCPRFAAGGADGIAAAAGLLPPPLLPLDPRGEEWMRGGGAGGECGGIPGGIIVGWNVIIRFQFLCLVFGVSIYRHHFFINAVDAANLRRRDVDNLAKIAQLERNAANTAHTSESRTRLAATR
jgi:hypothetical protein